MEVRGFGMEIDQFPRVPTLSKFSFCQISQFPYQVLLQSSINLSPASCIIIWNCTNWPISTLTKIQDFLWIVPFFWKKIVHKKGTFKFLDFWIRYVLTKYFASLPEIMVKKQSSVPKSQPLLSNFSSTYHNRIGALFISDCPQCSYLYRTEKASAESGKKKCTK